MKGRFIIHPNKLIPACIVPNNLTDDGEETYLKMIFQGDASVIAAGADFYMGLTDVTPSDDIDFADVVAAEPTIGTNGYARQALSRDSTGWPTLVTDAGETSIQSAVKNFAASGGDFDAAVTRAFLCTVSTGSAGLLLSISSAFVTAVTVADGDTLPIAYEAYLY
jgi:hypothetical protein